MAFVEKTNHTFEDALKEPVLTLFYVVAYIVEQKRKEEAALRQYKASH